MTQPTDTTRPIEIAYTKGFSTVQKRKIFKNEDALVKWFEKNKDDVNVLATTTDF